MLLSNGKKFSRNYWKIVTTEYGSQEALPLSAVQAYVFMTYILLGGRSCSFSPLSGNISDSCSEETVAKATNSSACFI